MITIEKINEDIEIYQRHTVILWGCRVLGTHFIDLAKKLDIKIYACCDNDESLWGTEFHGLPVISPKELEQLNKGRNEQSDGGLLVQLAVVEENTLTIEQQVRGMGIKLCVEFLWSFQINEKISEYFFRINPTLFESEFVGFQRAVNQVFFLDEEKIDENTILVCQKGKTGDNTILETCWEHKIPCAFLEHNPDNLKKLDKLKKKRITMAVRDPIAQSFSLLFEAIVNGDILSFEDISFEMFCEFLQTKDTQVLFDVLFEKKAYICDFFKKITNNGIDILQYPFDYEKGYTIIRDKNFDIFFYQLERLNDIVPQLSQWLGVPFDELAVSNVASSKWVAPYYKKAQKELRFSQDFFDACYNDPYVKHCYSEEDIEKFKERWRKNIDPSK